MVRVSLFSMAGPITRPALDERNPDAGREAVTCPFCSIKSSLIVASTELVVAIRDANAVTPFHTLVLPRRHVLGYFKLYLPEMMGIDEILRRVRNQVIAADRTVEGFNVGINVGAVAGQTIPHCAVHLIPRRRGDVIDPCHSTRFSSREWSLPTTA
jgi:diadenosine tetraphosphate (Ap4A) HIT family hydrolase